MQKQPDAREISSDTHEFSVEMPHARSGKVVK